MKENYFDKTRNNFAPLILRLKTHKKTMYTRQLANLHRQVKHLQPFFKNKRS